MLCDYLTIWNYSFTVIIAAIVQRLEHVRWYKQQSYTALKIINYWQENMNVLIITKKSGTTHLQRIHYISNYNHVKIGYPIKYLKTICKINFFDIQSNIGFMLVLYKWWQFSRIPLLNIRNYNYWYWTILSLISWRQTFLHRRIFGSPFWSQKSDFYIS